MSVNLPRPITIKFAALVMGVGMLVGVSRAAASPCAIVDAYSGESQILDRTRSQVVDLTRGAAITCGGWVSVQSGWVRIKHQNGYFLHLAPQTFVNLADGPDPIVLYKGEVFAQAGGGTGEMRIVTANGRVRVSRGRVIVSFSTVDDETQLIALENSATLENRFSSEGNITVRAGEASNINVSLQRILPSIPAAVSVSGLRPKMMALHLSEADQSEAVAAVTARKDRKFASVPAGDAAKRRAPASVKRHGRNPASDLSRYTRHKMGPEDVRLKGELARKLVGGENVGTQILFPDRYYGRTQQAQILVEDPQAVLNEKRRVKNDPEKQRLMRELSSIRVDQ